MKIEIWHADTLKTKKLSYGTFSYKQLRRFLNEKTRNVLNTILVYKIINIINGGSMTAKKKSNLFPRDISFFLLTYIDKLNSLDKYICMLISIAHHGRREIWG
jgi:hypothetical protein